MTDPDAIDEPASRYVTSQGVTLHYADWGNEGAPPLLLIHGTRDHARSWDRVARALRDRWHVMALDLRGHGDSGWSDDGAYLFPYHILDLVAVMEAIGPQPVTIIAHSFGGNVAARYAGLFPDRVRKIVFVDSLGPTPETYAQWAAAGPVKRTAEWIAQRRDPRQATSRTFATIDEAAARMAKANPHLTPEMALHLATYGVRRHEDGYRWKFDPRSSMFAPEDFAVQGGPYWAAVTAPVFILHGEKSWTTDPVEDGRAAFFQNARTLNFPDAGHWIHHDQLDGFLAAVGMFI